MSRRVLCIPTSVWHAHRPPGPARGSWPAKMIDLASLLASAHFVDRDKAEVCPDLKQPVPVAMLCWDDRVYCYPRRGAEARLHDRWSILVGGHVEPEDRRSLGPDLDPTPLAVALACLDREMREELGIGSPARARGPDWVVDDDDAVGRFHLGLCWQFAVAVPPLLPEGSELAGGRWMSPAEAWCLPLEGWSRIVLDAAFPPGTAPEPVPGLAAAHAATDAPGGSDDGERAGVEHMEYDGLGG